MNKETYIAPSMEVVNIETESLMISASISNNSTNQDASMANGFRGDWIDF